MSNNKTGELIRNLAEEKGISIELVQKTLESSILTAYKKYFGSNDNAVVEFDSLTGDLVLYSKKKIVDEVVDSNLEISNKDAENYTLKKDGYVYIEVDPKIFDRLSVQTAKQRTRTDLQGIESGELYSEFKNKLGKIVIGYIQQNRNDNLYVNLGSVDGILPKKFQSPREEYNINDKIRVLIQDVKKVKGGVDVILSRTHVKFIEELLHLEIPEIEEGIIKIYKIVRDPGYRTKVAVYTEREEIDPVGPCIGQKGIRIQSIIKELEGEKIDIVPYSRNIKEFIKEALTPAKVDNVYILDNNLKRALVVVSDDQLSLAIGKMGQNVKLANRLLDWSIDVKTKVQFNELKEKGEINVEDFDSIKANIQEQSLSQEEILEEEEITLISEMGILSDDLIAILKDNDLDEIEKFLEVSQDKLLSLGFSQEKIEEINKILNEGMVLIEEGGDDDEDELLCPECNALINENMTKCPKCGIGLSFEYEEE